MTITISREEFCTTYKAVHDSIFSGRLVEQHPFNSLEWRIALLPGGIRLENDVFEAIKTAAEDLGDKYFIVTDFETLPPHQQSVKLDWNYRNFTASVRSNHLLSTVDTHIFSQSGVWGVICYFDDFACIGGSAIFMGAFVRELGGWDCLKDRFRSFEEQGGWQISESSKAEILHAVGWDRE